MKIKDLPIKNTEIKGVEKPTPSKNHLQEYYKTLGDGEFSFMGIETGFRTIDMATLGLSGVVVLGGIAGGGKTTLALQLSYMACEKGTPVLFYSLEMPRRAVFTKILNRLAEVPYVDILLKGRPCLTGEGEPKKPLDLEKQGKLKVAQGHFEKMAGMFYVRTREDNQGIDFDTVTKDINSIKAEHNVDRVLVVVDHLQVFSVEGYKDQIDKEGRLITGFKDVSEKTNATILLISQKNKAGFQTSGLQTIKGSVDIVYLADVVMNLEAEDEKKDNDFADLGMASKVNLRIVKNRYNTPQTIMLDFMGQYSCFTDRSDRNIQLEKIMSA